MDKTPTHDYSQHIQDLKKFEKKLKRRITMLQIRDYFKRLQDHPGVPFGIFLTVIGAFAGAGNPNITFMPGWLFGMLVMGLFCWIPILTSNRKGNG